MQLLVTKQLVLAFSSHALARFKDGLEHEQEHDHERELAQLFDGR